MTNGRSSLGQLTNQLTQQQSQLQKDYYGDTMGNVGPWGKLRNPAPGHQELYDRMSLGASDPQAYNRLSAEAAALFQPPPASGPGGPGGPAGKGASTYVTTPNSRLPAGGNGTPRASMFGLRPGGAGSFAGDYRGGSRLGAFGGLGVPFSGQAMATTDNMSWGNGSPRPQPKQKFPNPFS